jgi:hypothetical protein
MDTDTFNREIANLDFIDLEIFEKLRKYIFYATLVLFIGLICMYAIMFDLIFYIT